MLLKLPMGRPIARGWKDGFITAAILAFRLSDSCRAIKIKADSKLIFRGGRLQEDLGSGPRCVLFSIQMGWKTAASLLHIQAILRLLRLHFPSLAA